MDFLKIAAATVFLAVLGSAWRIAPAQEPGELIFDPAAGQYLTFTPGDPGELDGCEPWDSAWWGPAWTHRFSLFAGVHGFRGPTDLGQNGNFGFHEGLNYGAPIGGPFGYSYQLGFLATHNNFRSDHVFNGQVDGRHQVFLTAGIFKRVMDFGLQSGMVFDFFHDDYYGKADLKQIRSETSLRLSEEREIGYWGAYNVGGDQMRLSDWIIQPLKPEDLFALFYRRHFSGGGQGRVWAGMSGDGDLFFGAETTVPMGTNWALENDFAYLFPDEGRGPDGRTEEIWAVSLRLVWYPGRPARCVFRDPYQPLLGVADNSVFMVKRD